MNPGEKSVFVETWGCQMNELDGRRFIGLLQRDGYREAPDPETADVILLNTCSIRDRAEQKVYDRLGRLAQLKRLRDDLVLGVCGCVAQQEGELLLKRLPHVDFVLGTGRIEALPSVVRRVTEEGDRPCEIGFDPDEVAYTPAAIARNLRHRASITVIEGCNKNCTFCVVPTTRGRERNRRMADVVTECRSLLEAGVIEIELLGQTVNAFRDPGTGEDFADLLRALSRLEGDGLRRLRFVTSHPKNFTDRLIGVMADSRVVCPALHLPVQSGSTRVLAKMKRQYSREDYLDLVARIREQVPGIAMATDIIVGFPTETEEDFRQSLYLVEEVGYASAFCFAYSPRPRTAAARWESDVTPAVASERLTRLIELQDKIQHKLNKELEGSTLDVLVDGPDRKGKRSSGRSPCNRVVNIDSDDPIPPGTFVQVLVEKGSPHSLLATPVRSRLSPVAVVSVATAC